MGARLSNRLAPWRLPAANATPNLPASSGEKYGSNRLESPESGQIWSQLHTFLPCTVILCVAQFQMIESLDRRIHIAPSQSNGGLRTGERQVESADDRIGSPMPG